MSFSNEFRISDAFGVELRLADADVVVAIVIGKVMLIWFILFHE